MTLAGGNLFFGMAICSTDFFTVGICESWQSSARFSAFSWHLSLRHTALRYTSGSSRKKATRRRRRNSARLWLSSKSRFLVPWFIFSPVRERTKLPQSFVNQISTEPVVMLVSIYLSILYGILYGFFEAFGVVYLEIRGFKSTSYGLTYIALGLGFLVAYILLATVGRKSVGRTCY